MPKKDHKPIKPTTALVEGTEQESPLTLIKQAIENKVDVDTIEKLMTLQERWEKSRAKKAFNLAMAAFQGECPIIKKLTDGGGIRATGKPAYKYATLDAIIDQTRELIQKHEFSYMIKTETMAQGVKVTCIVTHSLGHSESTDVSVPLGTKTAIMSNSQHVAAALTFAKRYAFCNAFGIMTGDEDDDAKTVENGTKVETAIPATDSDINLILKLSNEINPNKNFKLPAELSKARANKIITALMELKQKNGGNN